MHKQTLLGLVGMLAGIGCGSPDDGRTAEDPLPLDFLVDPTVVPAFAELPGFEDGAPRPLAAVVDERGRQAEFVENELWLATDDEAALATLLAAWNGVVVATIDPASAELPGLTRQHLVRVDPSAADPTRLPQDVRALDEGARGTLRISSERGLRLLAAAAHEAVAGTTIGVNWVGLGSGFRDRTTTEAPVGEAWGGVAYEPNAYRWPTHAVDAPQGLGVAEAWRMLEVAGRLGNRVRLAVLDMGFVPDADFPRHVALSNVPFVAPTGTANLIGCGGGAGCPWHGTNVVSAAMAVPDNGFGSAGPAGPVADAVLVFTLYDYFTSMTAVTLARAAGARILNLSYGAPVPALLSWTVVPFELTTLAVRASGALLFAAAGNDGTDVDEQDCFLGICWEDTLHTPCENAGVTCVGGLAWNATGAAAGSNWGSRSGVQLFAPYTQWLGPDPSRPGNAVAITNGTSFASPFAAGVAALVWAANPTLGAGDVADILVRTSHAGRHPRVPRSLDARAAVAAALGDAPPFVRILAPADGTSVSRAVTGLRLRAEAEDLEDGTPTVEWTSDRDGSIGRGLEVSLLRGSYGRHRITAAAVDRRGQRTSASVTVTLVNDAPVVEIREPLYSSEVRFSSAIALVGSGNDPNDGALAPERLAWYVDAETTPVATGSSGAIAGGTLAVGRHEIRLVGSDGELTGQQTTVVWVNPDLPGNVPPVAVIVSPTNDERVVADRWDAVLERQYVEVRLCGYGLDPEDDPFPTSGLGWSAGPDGSALAPLGTPGTDGCLAARFDLMGPYETDYDVRLTATDSAGDSGEARIRFTVWGLI